MAHEPLDQVAPQVAATLRAVYRVSRAARTAEQREAAARITNRWTVLALDAGWTNKQIADVIGHHHSVVARRASAHRIGELAMPPLVGVEGLQSPPSAEPELRSRLIAAAEVARLVGCVPGSVPYWAASRAVGFQWSPGGGRRLYDRDEVMAAAQAQPTVTHRKHRPRRATPVPPARRLTGTKSTWAKRDPDAVGSPEFAVES